MVPIPRSLGPRGRISLGPQLLSSSSSLSSPPRVVVEWAPVGGCKMTSHKSLMAHHLHKRLLGIWNIPDPTFILPPLPHRGFLDFSPYQSLFLLRTWNFSTTAEMLSVHVLWSFVVPQTIVMYPTLKNWFLAHLRVMPVKNASNVVIAQKLEPDYTVYDMWNSSLGSAGLPLVIYKRGLTTASLENCREG